MLSEIDYSGVLNENRIVDLQKESNDLRMIGKVSGGVIQFLAFAENKFNTSYVKDVQTHSKGGCIIIFEDNFESLYDTLITYWKGLSSGEQERISIMFSGNMEDIRTVSVYWRRETGFSTNDIADIVERNLFM